MTLSENNFMVYLIPSFLSDNATESVPPYVMKAAGRCNVFFAENIRTARRFLKKMDKQIIIDSFEWHEIPENEGQLTDVFKKCIRDKKNIGIISDAGCPGVADPGQKLVAIARQMNEPVKPLVGPNSILLALMASGMNGQQFAFHGYLPIEPGKRSKKIKQLADELHRRNVTQIFIETPYRNNVLLNDILRNCGSRTLLCVAVDLTSEEEWIKTRTISGWKREKTVLEKKPAIFLLGNGF